jgi:hypothetical protein
MTTTYISQSYILCMYIIALIENVFEILYLLHYIIKIYVILLKYTIRIESITIALYEFLN